MLYTDGMTIEEAIVAQAFEDYRKAIRTNNKKMLADVMRFFESKYYDALTKINYKSILRRLDKEWEDGQKLIAAGNKIECPELKKKYKFVCPLCGGKAHVNECKLKTKLGYKYTRSYNCQDCKTFESRVPFVKGGE